MQNKYNSIHFEAVINTIKCDTNHSFKYIENEKDESSKSTSENGFRKRNGFLRLIEANNYRLVKFKWKNDDINVIRKKKIITFFLKY